MNIKKLNNLNYCFVIAEAGSNWKSRTRAQSILRAKKLIDIAAECGADAIKFQTYRSESVYAAGAGKSKYLNKIGIKKSIEEIFDEFSMKYDMLPILKNHCEKRGIYFMSTPFSVEDAIEVNKYVDIHKVASYEINHIGILKYLAKTKKPIILSTGGCSYSEIDFAVKFLKKKGVKDIMILQCTAKYPAKLESLNLNVIPEMKKRYKLPVGLSDHSEDPIVAPLTAVGLGASIIEKHFTINKKYHGPDHFFALEPIELKNMIKAIRKSQISKGGSLKKVLPEEMELKRFAVRAIQSTRVIKKGERFLLDKNYSFLRPGNQKRGEEPRFWKNIEGKYANKNIGKGVGIRLIDCLEDNHND